MTSNILTVDLEDWFAVENLKTSISFNEWDKLSSRIEQNTGTLLQLFHKYDIRATFFILGWVAEKFPDLISEIALNNHEIACHSYSHTRVDQMDEKSFRADTEKAIEMIIKSTGIIPIGYRAPSWSINSSIPWAYEVLSDLGFKYDSSVFPVQHDIYGEPDAPSEFYKVRMKSGRVFYELPASTIKFFGRNVPVCGGGYLRHSPYWYTSRMIKKINRQNRPAIIYIHPWELDENQPRVSDLSAFQKYRQYGSIKTLKKKIEKLLVEFDFMTAGDYVNILTKKKIGFED